MSAARINGVIAVESDPVRRHERLGDLRLAAAVAVAPRIEVAESLLAAVAVPARRLDPAWVGALGLSGDVVLDEALTLRIVAFGPLPETTAPRRRRAA